METERREDVYTSTTTAVINRISWGAVFAGLVVAMVTQLALSILGIGIGASAIEFGESNRSTGNAVGIGAVIWFALTALISLFVGGYVAGRLAGVPRRQDACLHGILTWSAQTLVTFLLLTTAVGTVIGGMAGVLGRNLSFNGQNITEVLPQSAGGSGSIFEQVAGRAQSSPTWSAIENDAKALSAQAQGDAREFQRALKQMFNRPAGQPANSSDREALVSAVSQYTGKSPEEAEQQVARWEQMQHQAQQDQAVGAAGGQEEESVRRMADNAARRVSITALWTFGMLLLGAFAAAWGGASGRPRQILAETTIT